MVDFLLDRLPFPVLKWLAGLLNPDDPQVRVIVHPDPLPPPKGFVVHYVFNTESGALYEVRLPKDQDPEIYGSLHSPEICAEQGGECG